MEPELIRKLIRNWLLLVAGSIILMIITLLIIYYGSAFVPKIVSQILAVIQFSLIIIGIIFYLELRKLKKNNPWRIHNEQN